MSLFSAIIQGSRREFLDRSPASTGGAQAALKVCEVQEFERTGPAADLVPVRHYRTVYHCDGRISTEDLAIQSPGPAR